jgi:hypothetical protein
MTAHLEVMVDTSEARAAGKCTAEPMTSATEAPVLRAGAEPTPPPQGG